MKAVWPDIPKQYCQAHFLSNLEDWDAPAAPTKLDSAPQTIEQMREALKGSNVIIYERHSNRRKAVVTAETPKADRQRATDELVDKVRGSFAPYPLPQRP